MQAAKQAGRQADRQVGWQASIQAGRQAARQALDVISALHGILPNFATLEVPIYINIWRYIGQI